MSFLVLGSASGMVGSEMIRTRFSGITLMELFKELFCMGEVGGSSPLIFFVSGAVNWNSELWGGLKSS